MVRKTCQKVGFVPRVKKEEGVMDNRSDDKILAWLKWDKCEGDWLLRDLDEVKQEAESRDALMQNERNDL